MASLFKRDNPIERMETALAEKRAARERLAARLAGAEETLAERGTAAERLALHGAEDDRLDHADAALRATADRLATLKAALNCLDEQIAQNEAELADARIQHDRELVAAGLDRMAADIKQTIPAFDAAARAMIAAVSRTYLKIV
jgi:chromosome segregation ATPase